MAFELFDDLLPPPLLPDDLLFAPDEELEAAVFLPPLADLVELDFEDVLEAADFPPPVFEDEPEVFFVEESFPPLFPVLAPPSFAPELVPLPFAPLLVPLPFAPAVLEPLFDDEPADLVFDEEVFDEEAVFPLSFFPPLLPPLPPLEPPVFPLLVPLPPRRRSC